MPTKSKKNNLGFDPGQTCFGPGERERERVKNRLLRKVFYFNFNDFHEGYRLHKTGQVR